jgi:hypothetical protein
MNTNIKTARNLEDVQIKLSALWIAQMLTYFLGSVIGILAGDVTAGEIGGIQGTQIMWLGLAMLMVIPVVMVLLSLTYSWSRWTNIISAILFFGLNLIGLLEYNSAYITFLIIVGLVINVFIFRYSWRWSKQEAFTLLNKEGRVNS